MKTSLAIFAAALTMLTGCAGSRTPTVTTDGPRAPLANPASGTLNSPTTGPSSAGLPGGPLASPTDPPSGANVTVGGL